jgi:hypothetical protein
MAAAKPATPVPKQTKEEGSGVVETAGVLTPSKPGFIAPLKFPPAV